MLAPSPIFSGFQSLDLDPLFPSHGNTGFPHYRASAARHGHRHTA